MFIKYIVYVGLYTIYFRYEDKLLGEDAILLQVDPDLRNFKLRSLRLWQFLKEQNNLNKKHLLKAPNFYLRE